MLPSRVSHRGFSLVELLTATAVATLLMVILAGMSSQVSRLLVISSSQSQHRNSARAALNFMGREMRQAVLSLDTTGSRASKLQFIINPAGLQTTYSNRDSIFWQAPVSTTTTAGDLAEVGYFVTWTDNQPNLCRYYIPPSSPNYKIYTDPTNWVTNSLLSGFVPGTNYDGLFLENVAGLWINAYDTAGSVYGGDSRITRTLPARVEISLVLLDSTVVKRNKATISAYGTLNADTYLKALPVALREGAVVVNFSVVLDNAQ